MTPQQPTVELWLVDLTRCAPPLEALERETPRLADDDRERTRAIRDATARRERITAYTALRVLLERAVGTGARRTRLVRSTAGAPRLAGGGVRFSLSHTEGFALIGLAATLAVGVDLERTRAAQIARHRRDAICAAAAGIGGAPLPDVDPDRAMVQAWVRLEAFTKARGLALMATLADLGLRGTPPPTALADLERAARHLAQGAGLTISDVGLPCGLQGAMAIGSGGCVPAPRYLPADREGLAEVLHQPWPSVDCSSAPRIGLTC
jgi:4'-phosphopantetheinyl transferase